MDKNIINESSGANGLYNRYNQEKAKSDIKVAENQINQLESSKQGIKSKHKLSDIDKKVSSYEGVKNKSSRDIDYFSRREEKFHKKPLTTAELNKLKRDRNVDKGVMNSIMRKRNLAKTLSEVAELLND